MWFRAELIRRIDHVTLHDDHLFRFT